MAEATFTNATQVLEPFRGIKRVTIEEYFTSGHRTCQGCESALIMKLMVKAAGPRTIVLGSTGCMYVANTTYYTTPWVVPWMHTQLGSSGSAALGTAAIETRVTLRPMNREMRAPWITRDSTSRPTSSVPRT